MPAVGGHDVLAPPYRQQVIFGHDASHAFVVHSPALVFQFPAHPAIAVIAAMRKGDLLDPRPQLHCFGLWFLPLPVTIVPGSADPSYSAHTLDTQVLLRLLYASDFFVDAVSPQPSLARRRASILRKAPCKKSTSSAFLPRASRNCWISRLSCSSRVGGSPR